MIKLKLAVLLLLFTVGVSAQFKPGVIDNNKGFSNDLGATKYAFDIGSSVGFISKNAYWYSNYFSPSAKINLSNKFSLVAGIGIRYTNLNNYPYIDNEFQLQSVNTGINTFFAYASGIYKLSDKVNLNTTVLVEENIPLNTESPMALKKQYKDVSLGINYNVTPNFSINAQMQISDKPYMRNYGSNQMFGISSPTGYTPFF